MRRKSRNASITCADIIPHGIQPLVAAPIPFELKRFGCVEYFLLIVGTFLNAFLFESCTMRQKK